MHHQGYRDQKKDDQPCAKSSLDIPGVCSGRQSARAVRKMELRSRRAEHLATLQTQSSVLRNARARTSERSPRTRTFPEAPPRLSESSELPFDMKLLLNRPPFFPPVKSRLSAGVAHRIHWSRFPDAWTRTASESDCLVHPSNTEASIGPYYRHHANHAFAGRCPLEAGSDGTLGACSLAHRG